MEDFYDRKSRAKYLRYVLGGIVVLGGFYVNVTYMGKANTLLSWPAFITAAWPILAMINQWSNGGSVIDLVRKPTSFESEKAIFGPFCHETHTRWKTSFLDNAFGKAFVLYYGLFTYIAVIAYLYVADVSLLSIWIDFYHPFFKAFAELFPAYSNHEQTWSDLGYPFMGKLRIHAFFVTIGIPAGFLLYQFFESNKYVEKNRLKVSRAILKLDSDEKYQNFGKEVILVGLFYLFIYFGFIVLIFLVENVNLNLQNNNAPVLGSVFSLFFNLFFAVLVINILTLMGALALPIRLRLERWRKKTATAR